MPGLRLGDALAGLDKERMDAVVQAPGARRVVAQPVNAARREARSPPGVRGGRFRRRPRPDRPVPHGSSQVYASIVGRYCRTSGNRPDLVRATIDDVIGLLDRVIKLRRRAAAQTRPRAR